MSAHSTPRAFVIGQPIGHSRSPLLHGHWLRTLGVAGEYCAIAVAPDELRNFMSGFRAAGYRGGNVTVPHKQAVFTMLDRVEPEARVIGAVNTVWIDGDEIVGGNTDAHGFLANLDERAPGWDGAAGLAVVLGAGGAARAVIHGLVQRGFDIHIANRTGSRAHDLAEQFGPRVAAVDWDGVSRVLPTASLLVNTTSLGMAGQPPLTIDLSRLRPGAVVADIVYVPLTTDLLRDAAARGHRVVDGLGMLLHQAVPGFTRWFGKAPTVTLELRTLLETDLGRDDRFQSADRKNL